MEMTGSSAQPFQAVPSSEGLVTWTNVIYALHAISLGVGVLGAASVVGAFLIGWPSIVAVILNYVKQSEARGTWLESHFRWQIRTFWFGALWCGLCALFVLLTLGFGLFVVWIPLGLLALWFIYRIVRGWLALNNRRPMYS
jgi:uncharacterized membrane protein